MHMHVLTTCYGLDRPLITETLIPEQVDEEPDDDIPDNSTFGDHIRSAEIGHH